MGPSPKFLLPQPGLQADQVTEPANQGLASWVSQGTEVSLTAQSPPRGENGGSEGARSAAAQSYRVSGGARIWMTSLEGKVCKGLRDRKLPHWRNVKGG